MLHLSKIDDSLIKMRKVGLSLEYIRQFIIDYFDYKIGISTCLIWTENCYKNKL